MPATANEYTAAELKALYDRIVAREGLARYATLPPDLAVGGRFSLITFAGNYSAGWGGTAMPTAVAVAFGKAIVKRWPEIYAEVIADMKPVFKGDIREEAAE